LIAYILRRIAYTLPIAISVTVICFLLVHIAPGDPLQMMLPDNASPEAVLELKAKYGLDKPLPVQYFAWLTHISTGDLGTSISTGRSVSEELSAALGKTTIIAVGGAVLGFALGIAIGLVAGLFAETIIDRAAMMLAIAAISVPHYWLAIVMTIVFAVQLSWLPAIGIGPGGITLHWEDLRHLVLPVLTLSLIPMGIVARTVRGRVAELIAMDFVQTLRAKGLGFFGILRHVAKNAAPGVMAVMGLQLGYLLGGSILIETVFNWPGVGFLMSNAILRRDMPMLQGAILVLALLFVGLNLIVDLLQTAIDPRIRRRN
jgi:peptide/nickel transport system permease protein